MVEQPTAPRTFSADQALLGEILAQVVRRDEGETALDVHARTVELARSARAGQDGADEELADLVSSLAVHEVEVLVRSLTHWLQLTNLAEDNERIRRVRARERRHLPAPRQGSVRNAVALLADQGATADELRALLERAEVRPVLTAHPTEARRRTTLEKLARIFAVLRDADEREALPGREGAARRELLATVQELWGSDELRGVSPTVLDEVRAGLVYFVTTLADAVPVIYRDLEEALAEIYPGETFTVPPLLSFGSWMGGDRDGNHHVTHRVTAEALDVMRETCLRLYEDRLNLLAKRMSLSEGNAGAGAGIAELLTDGAQRFPVTAAWLAGINAGEPYRRVFSFLRERVRATRKGMPEGYERPTDLLDDLRVVEHALLERAGAFTAAGDLHDLIRQVEAFGFHFARMDVRDHAERHRAALDEIFVTLGLHDGYAALRDAERADLLCREIADRRPLVPTEISRFSPATQEVVCTFRMLAEVLAGAHRGAIESYIVSGTEGPADLLEVLLLMKEAALTRAGGEEATLRIVPLFEAGATLQAAPATMAALLERPVYRAALRAVGDEQEVMIGYSDSNKDVGYLASGWATYRAQIDIAEVLRAAGVSWTFFHGRGGAVGRGGGPTNVAIAALPPGTVAGRLKMTEQGEVLAAKYAVGEIAHRELELTASAVLATALDRTGPAPEQRARYEALMERMAADAEAVYRALAHDDPDFVRFFSVVTPVDEISRLRLGSRPAKRPGDGGIDDLRAIPWVFSWTQARIVLPAWYGLGTALEHAREDVGVDELREMERTWPFFAALLSNAEMACAKADPGIARRYVDLWEETEPRERIWGAIVDELERTRRELVAVCDGERLLDRQPLLQASIDRRNPYVDPLSYVQVELLRRLREGPTPHTAVEDLGRVSLLAVNGIAGGMRNTG